MRKDRTIETRERIERAAGIIKSERGFAGVAVHKGESLDWVVRFQTAIATPVEVKINGSLAQRTDSHVLDYLRTTLFHLLPRSRSNESTSDAAQEHALKLRSKELPPVPTWPCPHCGQVHTPATLQRLNNDHLKCAACRKSFPVTKPGNLR